MAELPSPRLHHLLSAISLDLGIENETPGFSVPTPSPFPPLSPYLGQRARAHDDRLSSFRGPNLGEIASIL